MSEEKCSIPKGDNSPTLWQRFKWWMRWQVIARFLPKPPSNLELHAERELRAAGLFDEDSDYGGMLAEAVMELVKVFASQGHSGFSAVQTNRIFTKIAALEPLCPLTGEDDEWNEIGEGQFQNNRCSHVFKDRNRFGGRAYDIDGRIFREPSGACYTSNESCISVTFPYTPTREYVDVETKS